MKKVSKIIAVLIAAMTLLLVFSSVSLAADESVTEVKGNGSSVSVSKKDAAVPKLQHKVVKKWTNAISINIKNKNKKAVYLRGNYWAYICPKYNKKINSPYNVWYYSDIGVKRNGLFWYKSEVKIKPGKSLNIVFKARTTYGKYGSHLCVRYKFTYNKKLYDIYYEK